MTNILQRTFKGAVGLAVLLAVMTVSSSPAWAQNCFARVETPTTARAEGLKEMAGRLDIFCTIPAAADANNDPFASAVPPKVKIEVRLNTPITNDTSGDDRVVGDLTLRSADASGTTIPSIDHATPVADATTETAAYVLGQAGGELSSDGYTITWEADTDDDSILGETAPFNLAAGTGFYLTISGILVDASARGHDNDVTAMVTVNGTPTSNTPRVMSEVLNGLMLKVGDMMGYQCQKSTKMVTLTIMEGKGFSSSIKSANATATPAVEADVLTVSFRGIPDGVTVMVPQSVSMDDDTIPTGGSRPTDDDGYFNLDIVATDRNSDDGVRDVEDGMAEVIISSTGSGMVRYTASATDNGGTADPPVAVVKDEKTELTVTFEWDGGDADLGTAMAAVSYSPVSGRSPEFVVGTFMDALMINQCATSLTFPFVTNMSGFDTGVALSNPSDSDGSCMVMYPGMPAMDHMEEVMAGMTKAFTVSSMAMGYQGIVKAECDFLHAEGLAFITNGAGMTPSLAHGYLAVSDSSGGDE